MVDKSSNTSVTLVAKKTLTPTTNNEKKIVYIKTPVLVLFVGGAGDKRPFLGTGPNGNITSSQTVFDNGFREEIKLGQVRSKYLGYYEIFGDEKIKNEIISPYLRNIKTPIFIVGHSLGGWNSAHLSSKLTGLGFKVAMLITLDPVGRSPLLAEIYTEDPKPKADFWINLRYEQNFFRADFFPNLIADAGVQWPVDDSLGANINLTIDVNHASTLKAMNFKLGNVNKTPMEMLNDSVKNYL